MIAKFKQLLRIIPLFILAVSCGDEGSGEGGVTPAAGTSYSQLVNTSDDLQTCSESIGNMLVYVSSESTFKYCNATESSWVDIDQGGVVFSKLLAQSDTNHCDGITNTYCYFLGGSIVKLDNGSIILTARYNEVVSGTPPTEVNKLSYFDNYTEVFPSDDETVYMIIANRSQTAMGGGPYNFVFLTYTKASSDSEVGTISLVLDTNQDGDFDSTDEVLEQVTVI